MTRCNDRFNGGALNIVHKKLGSALVSHGASSAKRSSDVCYSLTEKAIWVRSGPMLKLGGGTSTTSGALAIALKGRGRGVSLVCIAASLADVELYRPNVWRRQERKPEQRGRQGAAGTRGRGRRTSGCPTRTASQQL